MDPAEKRQFKILAYITWSGFGICMMAFAVLLFGVWAAPEITLGDQAFALVAAAACSGANYFFARRYTRIVQLAETIEHYQKND